MKKRAREPKPILPALASATGPGLIKHLASCNTTVRSQSLRLLQSWLLSETQQLSDSDIKKLWKGLFYCLWHADKSPNQLALINRLTSLFLSLQPALSLEFFRGFIVTLRREWSGIDRLRLDKFYLLIRCFMKSLFELMRLKKWDVEVLGEYFGVLEKDAFLAEDKLQGNGVNYHVVSVFLDELKGVGFPVRKEVLDVIFKPFFNVMMRGTDRILLGKVKSCLFDELVKMGKEILAKKSSGVDCDEKDGDVLLGVVALKMGLSEKLYQVGSSEECVQGNRKVLLRLHEEFLKLEKEVETSGFEIAIPEYSDSGDYDEVPQLIPIDFDALKATVEIGAEDNDVILKKKKKNKKAKKEVDEDDKKKRKKKKLKGDNVLPEINSAVAENGDSVMVNETENLGSQNDSESNPSVDLESDGAAVNLDENVILNLQKQFEKVAAEMGSESDQDSDTPIISVKRSKRKRTKIAEGEKRGTIIDGGVDGAASVEKSGKKVRFSMKNNLVWKPQTPLPPESLRLPPSVTPRGSALKKGVLPGPIVEMPSLRKKAKLKKKGQKRVQTATPMTKRRKNMQTRSA
ncbi:hypothetical protein ABFS83_11G022800 [Erythranthe nasuta]